LREFNSRRNELKNLLSEDFKLSKKWSSVKIVHSSLETRYQDSIIWVKPLFQIFTYCVKAKAQYEYIITDKELVALRVRYCNENDQVTETFDDSQLFDSQGTASDVQHSRTQAASITESQTKDSEIDTQTSDESESALAYKVIL